MRRSRGSGSALLILLAIACGSCGKITDQERAGVLLVVNKVAEVTPHAFAPDLVPGETVACGSGTATEPSPGSYVARATILNLDRSNGTDPNAVVPAVTLTGYTVDLQGIGFATAIPAITGSTTVTIQGGGAGIGSTDFQIMNASTLAFIRTNHPALSDLQLRAHITLMGETPSRDPVSVEAFQDVVLKNYDYCQ